MTLQGLEWAGFPALAFYMHTILEETNIPVDEYWAAGFISLYRLISHRALMPHWKTNKRQMTWIVQRNEITIVSKYELRNKKRMIWNRFSGTIKNYSFYPTNELINKLMKKLSLFYWTNDFTEQTILLNEIVQWENGQIRWKMNHNFENKHSIIRKWRIQHLIIYFDVFNI